MPFGTVTYLSSRVSAVMTTTGGTITLGSYRYQGVGRVVVTKYPEADVKSYDFDSYRDRFMRVNDSWWFKDLTTDLNFYDVDVTYDRNSNITLTEDQIFTGIDGSGFDVDYTIDGLNRLTQAEEGVWGGSSITATTRDQQWTLDQIGNWELAKWDENGNGTFTDTGDYNDDRTFNVVNELTGRDTDDNGTDDYTLVYDANGNLTDDGENYEYEYDAFGRLRKLTKTSDQSLIAEFRYNGMNHRITIHEDTDADGDVDVNDDVYHFAFNERWQNVAIFHEDDDADDPKKQFIYHMAGLGAYGGSSYIDNVILRDMDANTAWTAQSDGVLEQRVYYCHNWRNDIVALLDDAGAMHEWDKYDSYGRPYGILKCDTNGDGTVDNATDYANLSAWWGTTTQAHVTADWNLDGAIDVEDLLVLLGVINISLGWDALSFIDNRHGYAGYEEMGQANVVALYHVRNRVFNPVLGRWNRRDPLGYVDGWNVYEYVTSNPVMLVDPLGLAKCAVDIDTGKWICGEGEPENLFFSCARCMWGCGAGWFASKNCVNDATQKVLDCIDCVYSPNCKNPWDIGEVHWDLTACHQRRNGWIKGCLTGIAKLIPKCFKCLKKCMPKISPITLGSGSVIPMPLSKVSGLQSKQDGARR